MDIQREVGSNIKRLREDLGWSQDHLSDLSGLHRTYISGVERGVRNPTLSSLYKIADALNVKIIALFANHGAQND